MKNLSIFLIALSLSSQIHATAIFSLLDPPIAAYVDEITNWWGCDVPNGLGLPVSGSSTSYNTVILSFWLSNNSPADAVSVWADFTSYVPTTCGYGTTNSAIQQYILKAFHNAGINVLVSAFGSTNYPTDQDPTQVCTSLAQWVLANNVDGVDLDYEDTAAFDSQGTGENWLITCTKVLRQYLPQNEYIITHAPQGPYFTTANLYPKGAYLTIDSQVGNLIDWYNLQYYNQGADVYTTYSDQVVSCEAFPGTAILELHTHTTYGIAVGKPASTAAASNGYVAPGTLVQWLQQAHSNNGWCGGAMYWELADDQGGVFGTTLKQGLKPIAQGCTFGSI